MFYCNECADKNGYPESISKSNEKCEYCGKIAICNNRASSTLPYTPKKLDVIVITENLNDCIELHEYTGDVGFKKEFTKQYPLDPNRYDTTWYWWFDRNNKLAGNSGHGALETAIKLNIGARIYPIDDFLKAKLNII